MQKSVLQALIEKVSQGDQISIKKLTKKLCDRLVFVPTLETKNEGTNKVKVSVIRVREGDRKIIPIFLTQQSLKKWLDLMEMTGEGMAIYCSDICKALGNGNWLMLEAGSQYWAELEPKYGDEIAAYEPEEDDDFLEPDQWSMREKVSQVEPKPIPQQMQSEPKPLPVNTTQEVPIVPHPMTIKHNMNPSEKVTQFPAVGKTGAPNPPAGESERSSGLKRFRHNDDDDVRSTMDLTALRNQK